jgi:hypothetical protein
MESAAGAAANSGDATYIFKGSVARINYVWIDVINIDLVWNNCMVNLHKFCCKQFIDMSDCYAQYGVKYVRAVFEISTQIQFNLVHQISE